MADVEFVMAQRQLLADAARYEAGESITALEDGQPVPAGNGHPGNGHRPAYPWDGDA